ncbi:hypothetical protein H8S33_17735 [Ornithinibacillus sp. BX22]|uniref:Uncharacterized protein n=2 Tax=Ornithinibacillus TaxID=484508 RepID=A0A923RK74_9BACI|nr:MULTISPECIES: hypothetical protein [Ornithinibacillus]MBC5638616.1 hypothetical protein [Ornithinibacillus hominis]MBS3681985.1 hypothetical protein [Ornithinibacillus massiliensis]
MPKMTYIVCIILSVFVIAITVFSFQSEESIIAQAGEKAEEVFYSEDIPEDNYEGEYFSFYLPANMNVEEVDMFNAIVHDGDQPLLVFYNTLEDNKSQLNYEAAKIEDVALLESFSGNDKFGYIRLLPEDENMGYELQIGVGGVKLTTFTSKNKAITDSENLMKIALSIVE